MKKRVLLSPADDTASSMLITIQTATTRVKEIVTSCVSKGIADEELTVRLNKEIATECRKIGNPVLREQVRKSLISSAKKWHYELKRTYNILERNFSKQANQQPFNIDIHNLLQKTPFEKQAEFRRLLDDGTNPGIPVIKDYQKSVRLAVKAISADPPKIVTTKDGKSYVMPARLRAELAVRYAAAVENLQRLIDEGVFFCWITSHANCSPRCASYQGKLYSLFQGKAVINGKEYGEKGTIDGIPYRPINEALAGPKNDGNGCISGYNCRHRAIEYKEGSRPPQDFTEAQIKRAYAIDKKQRAYENQIRHLKTEEKQLRACGMEKEASAIRKKWQAITKEYKIYSVENDRAFYPYRYVIDRSEETENLFETDFKEKDEKTVDNPVNWSIINNKQYFDELENFIGGKKSVVKSISRIVLDTLRHRDHSDREDLYFVDARNGQIADKNINSNERLKVLPTKKMKRLLEIDDGKQYILFHNHPLSSPPSAADLNSLRKNPKISFGIIVGHNGTIYKYTAPQKEIDEADIVIAIKYYAALKYSQETAEKMAYKTLGNKFKFAFEVFKNERR